MTSDGRWVTVGFLKDQQGDKREKKSKSKLFHFDPSTFKPLPKAKWYRRRLFDPVRHFARHGFYGIMFAYPVSIIIIGLVFGGLVFWLCVVGSGLLLWLMIRQLGCARNFESWDISLRRFATTGLAFLIVLGFFAGVEYLNTWAFLIFAISLGMLGFLVFLRRPRT